MGTLTLHDAPHINYDRLKPHGLHRGRAGEDRGSRCPACSRSRFAFSPWTLGADVIQAPRRSPKPNGRRPDFNLLRKLGFTKKQIDEANDVICGRGTVEGAPHLKDEHLPVFDCANKCGKTGKRFIPVEGHIRMMAAAQPFISGAISKTINLPNEATRRGHQEQLPPELEAGPQGQRPLSRRLEAQPAAERQERRRPGQARPTRKTRKRSKPPAKKSPRDVARAAVAFADSELSTEPHRRPTTSPPAAHAHRSRRSSSASSSARCAAACPTRATRSTHKFDVAGHEGYITVGLYEDGQPGEVFIRMAKEGSTIGGLMDTIATLVSVSLQYGVPVESLVRKFEHVRFEPSGMTRNPEIPIAKSLVDYIFRWLAMEFVPGYRAANAPQRPRERSKPASRCRATPAAPSPAPGEGRGEGVSNSIHSATPHSTLKHSPSVSASKIDRLRTKPPPRPSSAPPQPAPSLRLAIVADPLSQQGSQHASRRPRVRRLREHHGAERHVLQVPELREFDGVQLTFRDVRRR